MEPVAVVERERVGWGRRLLGRGLLGALAALLLSAGLVVNAVPAQAFVPPPPLPLLIGSTVGGDSAAVAAGALLGPAGWVVLGTAAIGLGLYATRDTWMPFLSRTFGAEGEHVSDGLASACASLSVSASGAPGAVFSLTTALSCSDPNLTVYARAYTLDTVCMLAGAASASSVNVTTPTFRGTGWGTAAYSRSVYSSQCPNMGSLVWLQTRPAPGSLATSAPSNFVSWGSPGGIPDGVVTYKVTSNCVLADGTRSSVVAQSSGLMDGFTLPSCVAAGKGLHADSALAEAVVNGKSLGTIWQVQPNMSPEQPGCSIDAIGVCKWMVKVDGIECQTGTTRCLDWTRTRASDPQRVECYWGPYLMPSSRCDLLERAYEANGTRVTQANTDGDPDTLTAPSVTTATGTGADPGATAGTGTGTGTDPGGSTGPGTISGPTPSPEQLPDESNDCWPSGWGMFNPATWVLQPTKCALKWAFIPAGAGEAFSDWWDDMGGRFGQSPMGSWGRALRGWTVALGAGGAGVGCQGPAVPTGFLGEKGALPAVIYPFDACSGVKAQAAAASNIFLTVSIMFVGGLKAVRIIGRPFGYDLDLMNNRGSGS